MKKWKCSCVVTASLVSNGYLFSIPVTPVILTNYFNNQKSALWATLYTRNTKAYLDSAYEAT